MDPNLIKIRDHNIQLIHKNKIRLPMMQAKDYLTQILTKFKQIEIEKELKAFEVFLKKNNV